MSKLSTIKDTKFIDSPLSEITNFSALVEYYNKHKDNPKIKRKNCKKSKKYAKENPDKIKEDSKKRRANPEYKKKKREADKIYVKNHPEQVRKYKQKYKKGHPENTRKNCRK